MNMRSRNGSSRYLKAIDYPSPEVVTITDVKEASIGLEKEIKAILFFEEADKPLVLNKGNTNTLGELFGWESDDWIGQQVEIYTDPTVTFQGKRTPALRLRAVNSITPNRKGERRDAQEF